jgi:hypothetical protein
MSEEQTINEISAIVDGSGIFESTGYSRIAVTTAGVKRVLRIPITTRGVDAIIREMEAKAPRPPVIVREATPEESESLGIEAGGQKSSSSAKATADMEIRTFDFADPNYLEAIQNHGDEGVWRIAIQGMSIKYGTEEDLPFEKKKEILLSHGITTHHIIRIYADIRKLTRIQEDREDFLQNAQLDSQEKLNEKS